MMRHAVGLSETVDSMTEMIEANYVATYYSRMIPQVVGLTQRWPCWWWERLQSHFGRGA